MMQFISVHNYKCNRNITDESPTGKYLVFGQYVTLGSISGTKIYRK